MNNVRPAATIMLTRDYEGKLEVLLLKRNKALAFAAGAWVFPGGKIDPADQLPNEDEAQAAKRAAVREAREEADLHVEIDDLVFYRHWTTPANEPRRYATWFFLGTVNNSFDKVQVDKSEIIDYRWLSPQHALDQYQNGQLLLLPPTLISLQLIRHCNSVAEARRQLIGVAPLFVVPVVHFKDGQVIIMYEGDAGYRIGDAGMPGARHRLILDPSRRTTTFLYEDCFDHLPVNNGDDFFG